MKFTTKNLKSAKQASQTLAKRKHGQKNTKQTVAKPAFPFGKVAKGK